MFFSKHVAGLDYVARDDTGTPDFNKDTIGDATSDLDFSSVIPANAKIALLCVVMLTTAGVGSLSLIPKGYIGGLIKETLIAYSNGVSYYKTMHVSPDSAGLIRAYKQPGVTYLELDITVQGWFV